MAHFWSLEILLDQNLSLNSTFLNNINNSLVAFGTKDKCLRKQSIITNLKIIYSRSYRKMFNRSQIQILNSLRLKYKFTSVKKESPSDYLRSAESYESLSEIFTGKCHWSLERTLIYDQPVNSIFKRNAMESNYRKSFSDVYVII